MQSQKAASAYFTSKQMLPFGSADQYLFNTPVSVPHGMTTRMDVHTPEVRMTAINGGVKNAS